MRTFVLAIIAAHICSAVSGQGSTDYTELDGVRWSTERLTVKYYRNGDPIQEARSAKEWEQASIDGVGAWCYYKNNDENERYGILYNWEAVTDPRGIGPEGWRLPTEEEAKKLNYAVGGKDLISAFAEQYYREYSGGKVRWKKKGLGGPQYWCTPTDDSGKAMGVYWYQDGTVSASKTTCGGVCISDGLYVRLVMSEEAIREEQRNAAIQEELNKQMADADRFFDQQAYPTAAVYYERVLKIEPGNAHAQERLAICREKMANRELEIAQANRHMIDSLVAISIGGLEKNTGTAPFGDEDREWTEIMGTKWATSNLNVDEFQNGDPIYYAKTVEEWNAAAAAKKPAYCYLHDDPENGEVYGKMYNWYAVTDSRGLAPAGWRLPDENDMNTFFDLPKRKVVAELLKSTKGWQDDVPGVTGNGIDFFGFNALPGGSRSTEGAFESARASTVFWTTSQMSDDLAVCFIMNSGRGDLIWSDQYEYFGAYVRCVKD